MNKRKVNLFLMLGFIVGGMPFEKAFSDDATPAATTKTTSTRRRVVKRTASPTAVQKKSTVSLDTAAAADHSKRYGANFEAWLKKMKKRVVGVQTKRNKLIAVAAVRGDEVKEAPPLYWKGKKAESPVKDEELNAFNQAIESALKGESADAKTKLESFVSTYPQSPMVPDAQETLNLMNKEASTPAEATSAN